MIPPPIAGVFLERRRAIGSHVQVRAEEAFRRFLPGPVRTAASYIGLLIFCGLIPIACQCRQCKQTIFEQARLGERERGRALESIKRHVRLRAVRTG